MKREVNFFEYDGNPIFVHYHALNNGHTEDSTAYLEKEIPYLKKYLVKQMLK